MGHALPLSARYRPDPRWPSLGDAMADPVPAARFPLHRRRWRHQPAAASVGLDELTDAEWEVHFARFEPLPGNLPEPLALRYHGHQFLAYNPHLGDGRGFLHAQLRDERGRLMDLGTKGTGTTPWSRGGDGRLTLKGGVREVLASEMLAALGVDTCRILSLYETGEELFRGDEPSPARSSVLVRLQHSHVRIGTFQRLYALDRRDEMARMVAYCNEHLVGGTGPADLLAAATANLARTCGRWMVAGFVHGVLNTDNLLVTGQSFDYGPWRFLPVCDPTFTAAYFDDAGIFAFGRQPWAVRWSLEQLCASLALLEPGLKVTGFEDAFWASLRGAALWRLGVASRGDAADAALVGELFAYLERSREPFDRFWTELRGGPSAAMFGGQRGAGFDDLRRILADYEPAGQPVPHCGMLIDEMEALWAPIAYADDWAPLYGKLEAIRELGRALEAPPGS
jgi:uncharacterized protein YdiU (UPF0061 family)